MNFLRTVFALCTGFASYRAYRDLPLTTSLKHLVKLITPLALVLAVCAIPLALNGIDAFAHHFDDHRPDFSIKDGKIVTTVTQRVSWGDPKLRFVLDTSSANPVADTNSTFGVLFTADSFLYWMTASNAPAPVSTHLQSLRGFPDGAVDGDYFRRLIRAMLWILVPIGWVTLAAVGLLCCLLQAYFFSVIASLLERSMPAPLKLSQLLNIAIHAATPPAIVVTIYSALRLPGLNMWLVYLIVYGIFLVGASNACRDHLRRVEPPPPMPDDLL
jgi:hypothetical protein